MFDKEFLPTSSKLSDLRSAGILPYSSFVTRLVQLAIILSICVVWRSDLLNALQLKTWLNLNKASLIFEQLKPVGRFFLALAFITLFTNILVGLLQNKFYFNLSLASFNTKNLWFKNRLSVISSSLSMLVQILLAFISAVILTYILAPKVIKLLEIEKSNLKAVLLENESNYVGLLVLIWLVLMVIALLISRFAYRFKHRMSQSEIQKEALSSD